MNLDAVHEWTLKTRFPDGEDTVILGSHCAGVGPAERAGEWNKRNGNQGQNWRALAIWAYWKQERFEKREEKEQEK